MLQLITSNRIFTGLPHLKFQLYKHDQPRFILLALILDLLITLILKLYFTKHAQGEYNFLTLIQDLLAPPILNLNPSHVPCPQFQCISSKISIILIQGHIHLGKDSSRAFQSWL